MRPHEGAVGGGPNPIKHEFSSADLYLAMSAYCESVNLLGCAHWMRLQSQEELSHGTKLFELVHERGGRAKLQAIDQPPGDFQSPLDIFQKSLEHEHKVTGMIHRLYGLAVTENDYATQIVLQWFITEQVEEEKNASQIVEQLKMIGGQSAVLLMLDRPLAARSAD